VRVLESFEDGWIVPELIFCFIAKKHF
jgi:hypothetical protein